MTKILISFLHHRPINNHEQIGFINNILSKLRQNLKMLPSNLLLELIEILSKHDALYGHIFFTHPRKSVLQRSFCSFFFSCIFYVALFHHRNVSATKKFSFCPVNSKMKLLTENFHLPKVAWRYGKL